jgi:hypothetical protein
VLGSYQKITEIYDSVKNAADLKPYELLPIDKLFHTGAQAFTSIRKAPIDF